MATIPGRGTSNDACNCCSQPTHPNLGGFSVVSILQGCSSQGFTIASGQPGHVGPCNKYRKKIDYGIFSETGKVTTQEYPPPTCAANGGPNTVQGALTTKCSGGFTYEQTCSGRENSPDFTGTMSFDTSDTYIWCEDCSRCLTEASGSGSSSSRFSQNDVVTTCSSSMTRQLKNVTGPDECKCGTADEQWTGQYVTTYPDGSSDTQPASSYCIYYNEGCENTRTPAIVQTAIPSIYEQEITDCNLCGPTQYPAFGDTAKDPATLPALLPGQFRSSTRPSAYSYKSRTGDEKSVQKTKWRVVHYPAATCYGKAWYAMRTRKYQVRQGTCNTFDEVKTGGFPKYEKIEFEYTWQGSGNPCIPSLQADGDDGSFLDSFNNRIRSADQTLEAPEPSKGEGYAVDIVLLKESAVKGFEPDDPPIPPKFGDNSGGPYTQPCQRNIFPRPCCPDKC